MSAKIGPGKSGGTQPDLSSLPLPTSHAEFTPSDALRSERSPEQLLKDNELLSQELVARAQEIQLLNEVISTVGSTLKLDEVLSHVVDTVTRATSCHAAFLYLYDPDRELLVLSSASEPFRHQINKISMALGEGIAGWVGKHLEPVTIPEGSVN